MTAQPGAVFGQPRLRRLQRRCRMAHDDFHLPGEIVKADPYCLLSDS